MEQNNNLKYLGRESLKSLFANGNRPDESNFESLINSFVNRLDDGFMKNKDEGFVISLDKEGTDKLMSFYKDNDDSNAEWALSLNKDKPDHGFNVVDVDDNGSENSRLYIQKKGNIGINTMEPKVDFHVNGVLGIKNRLGVYAQGKIPADGDWHDIVTGLNDCSVFEVIAQVGQAKTGRHAILHATLASAFGNSRNRIRKTQARFSRWKWMYSIAIRWTGEIKNYGIQIKTRRNFGDGVMINYSVTNLWDENIQTSFNEE